jgi:hypothetical protein
MAVGTNLLGLIAALIGPPSMPKRREGSVEIASILAAGLLVCAYLSSGGRIGQFEEMEKLVAFACDASIFVATYNRRKDEHERRL